MWLPAAPIKQGDAEDFWPSAGLPRRLHVCSRGWVAPPVPCWWETSAHASSKAETPRTFIPWGY